MRLMPVIPSSLRWVLLIGLLTLVLGCLFLFSQVANRRQVFQEHRSTNGVFLVIGENNWPQGWDVTLYWKRSNQPWAAYYLDHKASYWQQVQIVQAEDQLLVKRSGNIEGCLNLKEYSFTNFHQNYTHMHPMYLVLDRNPFSSNKKYVDSSGWSLVWPTMSGYSIPDDWQADH